MPTAGAAEFGLWVAIAIGIVGMLLTSVVAVLTILVLWRNLNSKPADGTEYVTAAQLVSLKVELKEETGRIDRHVHSLATEMQVVKNLQAAAPYEFRKMMDLALRPIQAIVSLTRMQLVQIATKLALPPIVETVVHAEEQP